MEDSSHEFLVSRWYIQKWFIDLGKYPFEVLVHYLLIREIASLSYWDEIPMVNVLMCMVIHWIEPTVSHDIRLSGSHNFTKLIHNLLIRGNALVCNVFQVVLLDSKLVRGLKQSIWGSSALPCN